MEEQTTENLAQEPSIDENKAPEGAEEGQEGSRFEHIKETLELLCQEFPQAFIKEGEVKPLKIGIFDDLKAAVEGKPGFSLSKVRAALRLYTTRLRYFEALKLGAKRVDLQGNEGEEVSVEHADFAAEKIAEIKAKIKAKRPARNSRKPGSKGEYNKGAEGRKSRPNRIPGVKAAPEDLTVGRDVMVLTGENHYIYGIIKAHDQTDKVLVTLKTGMTVNVTVDRILLPNKNK
ncbi:MAG: RNA chaperone ProQ [Succinivibrio sp.]|nr:RNA chaperone ProQ [Succinivibrio sp.]